ncbi:MAG TPA: hypothetical protein DEV81_00180 [Cyanobacteria bacterium UBA11049]|nr:hypothetical protein [Cyanobacteria bacterium UBA11049]
MNNSGNLVANMERIKSKIAQNNINLGKPLSLAAIEKFETQHSIILPEDYRQFLLEISNGGDGPPEYRLKVLAETVTEEMQPLQPFPLSNYWVWDDVDDVDEELFDSVYRCGHLYLGTEGCGIDWILIVNSAARGKVWQRSDEGIVPCTPARSFISWYEYWLDGGENWFDGQEQ